jgi:hypothetical protein
MSSTDLVWKRAEACNADGCLELAAGPGGVIYLRDSHRPDQVIETDRDSLAYFWVGHIAGDFDEVSA